MHGVKLINIEYYIGCYINETSEGQAYFHNIFVYCIVTAIKTSKYLPI